MRGLFIGVVVCSFTIPCSAQFSEDDIIENTINQTNGEFDNENIIEDLRLLLRNPININDTTANFDRLIQYNIIHPVEVEYIKEHIRKYGELITDKEVYSVEGVEEQSIDKFLPFVSVNGNNNIELNGVEQFQKGISRIVLRDQIVGEDQRGFTNYKDQPPKYLGDKHHSYFKIQHRYKSSFSIGALGDKDAGEEWFTGNNKQGFDFYSAHLKYQPKAKWLNQINLGDYEVKVGQGLIQWNGFTLGKGVDATTVFLKSPILREYTSSNELNYLRGAAADVQINSNFSATTWFSYKGIDANQLFNDEDEEIDKISSIQRSGFHRTINEIEDKRSSNETIAGANLQYENDWLKVGFTAQHQHLSDSLVYRNQEYQRFYPKGNDFTQFGVNYTALKKRNYFFGETATTNSSFATVNGIQHYFNGGVKGTLVYRNYGKAYKSEYAAGLSESTSPNNEQAIYAGIQFSPIPNVTVQSYVDLFSFPYQKFRVSEPSTGQEFLLQTIYQHPEKQLQVELRNKLEHKQINATGSQELTLQKRYASRLEMRYHLNDKIYLKSRLGHTFYEKSDEGEHGWLGFQDVVYEPFVNKLKLYSRFAKFYSPTYNSRNYAYENDLLYNFSVPAYYGQGNRYYGMISYAPVNAVKLWLKASQTYFLDRDNISSSNNKIEGNKRTDYKFQLQIKF